MVADEAVTPAVKELWPFTGSRCVDRRPGDIAKCYADPARARDELGWEATRDVAQMCADTWHYQTANGKA